MKVDLERQVRDTLATLAEEEQRLAEAIKELEVRLSRVRAARSGLAGLDSEEPVEFEGKLVDAIRTALMAKRASHAPTQVRDMVKALGYTFRENSNQMAAVHGVLKRLVESGEVKTKEWPKQPGIVRYYWHAFEDLGGDQPVPFVDTSSVMEAANRAIAARHASHERAVRAVGAVAIDPITAPPPDKAKKK